MIKRLLITRPLPAPVIAAAESFAEVEVRGSNAPMDAGEMAAALAAYDAIVPTLGDACTAEVLAQGGRCGLLANFGVGYNHIDVAAAAAAGVAVTTTPGAVTDATADIALTLMLMAARRAGEGERLVRSGAWEGWHPPQLLGMHMSGKTVGIIGMGRIGQAIAALGPAGFLVNIARGDVIDEAALIAALEAKTIAGAGLDVYENEPEVPAALRARENVVLLPHLGTNALEVRIAMGRMAVENVRAHFEGAPLINPV